MSRSTWAVSKLKIQKVLLCIWEAVSIFCSMQNPMISPHNINEIRLRFVAVVLALSVLLILAEIFVLHLVQQCVLLLLRSLSLIRFNLIIIIQIVVVVVVDVTRQFANFVVSVH